jgi:hypothetical protein
VTIKFKETPSTYACHKGANKEENKPETERNIVLEMGECSYSKTQVPFCVEDKVEIKPYDGEVDAIKMKQWLKHMEFYFNMHEVTKK